MTLLGRERNDRFAHASGVLKPCARGEPHQQALPAEVVALDGNRKGVDTVGDRAIGKSSDQPRAQALPLPTVRDDDRHVRLAGAWEAGILCYADNLAALHGGDRLAIVVIDAEKQPDEIVRLRDRAQEPPVDRVG